MLAKCFVAVDQISFQLLKTAEYIIVSIDLTVDSLFNRDVSRQHKRANTFYPTTFPHLGMFI